MTQLTELRDLCDDFGLTTELALGPADTSSEGQTFELIVDFDSGQVKPERAIAAVEDEFNLAMYDASAAQNDHSITGEYALAISA